MKSLRFSIATIVSALICIGIVMIYSSSGVYALEHYGHATYFVFRHMIFVGIGTVLTMGIMAMDYRMLQAWAKPLALISLGLLIFVLIPGIGSTSFGARRWFKLGPIHFQPSELAKMAVLIYTADFLARKQKEITFFRQGFLPPLLVMGIMSLCVLRQPDLGNAVLMTAIVFTLIFVAGAQWRHLLGLVGLTLPVLILLIVRVPYRMARIIAFLDPWKDRQGVGFQLSQSQIALGSGEIFGVGLGQSVQKLFYLPAAHTDFILSIIGEEFGILGTLTVVALFGAFIWQGARMAKRITNPFGYYLAVGIVVMLGFQAVVNIGVSIGALPTKGLPLPFISYGGSALIFHMMAVGLLLNISRMEKL